MSAFASKFRSLCDITDYVRADLEATPCILQSPGDKPGVTAQIASRQTPSKLVLALCVCFIWVVWELGFWPWIVGLTASRERDVVCFVTHSPTAAQAQRMKDYADQLEGVADVWVAIDVTPSDQLPDPPAHSLFENSKSVNVFEFTESNLESRYPKVIRNVMRDYKDTNDWGMIVKQHPNSILAYTHRDSVILELWHFLGRPSNRKVWFFESDVGVSGSMRDLILSYQSDGSDLIRGDRWLQNNNPDQSSKKFVKKVLRRESPRDRQGNGETAVKGLKLWEFAQRLGPRAFEVLENHYSRGSVSMSEGMLPSLCIAERLYCSTFHSKHIGDAFYWSARVSEEEWNAITRRDENKIYHALKF